MAVSLSVNGKQHTADVDPQKPLLWVLREDLGIMGPKYGCGAAQCGACTVHIDGQAMRSCQATMGALAGKKVVTIEGLGGGGQDHPVQRAWIANNVAQCGYCQVGQIMQAAALLAEKPKPTDAQIDEAMAGNVCRCGTYQRIRAAIKSAAGVRA